MCEGLGYDFGVLEADSTYDDYYRMTGSRKIDVEPRADCVLKMAQGVVVVVPTIVGLGTALPKKDRSAPNIPPLAVMMNASLSRTNTRSLTWAQLVDFWWFFPSDLLMSEFSFHSLRAFRSTCQHLVR